MSIVETTKGKKDVFVLVVGDIHFHDIYIRYLLVRYNSSCLTFY